jgi:hypothetical protein
MVEFYQGTPESVMEWQKKKLDAQLNSIFSQ